MRVNDALTGLDGGELVLATSRKSYLEALSAKTPTETQGGSVLFGAIRYAVGDLLVARSVQTWLELNVAEPTVIAIGDGFNAQRATDTCGTNAARLQRTLEQVGAARNAPITLRPTVHTVGLGKPYNPAWQPSELLYSVDESSLCGEHAATKLDGGLEAKGYDNASMTWLAQTGGGSATSAATPADLAKALQGIAAARPSWYEVKYSFDAITEGGFHTDIAIDGYAKGGATIEVDSGGPLVMKTAKKPAPTRAKTGSAKSAPAEEDKDPKPPKVAGSAPVSSAGAPTGTPGSVAVISKGQSFLAIEVRCPNGTRKRAAFSGNKATAKGIPGNEDCTLLFKGGLPAKYTPVRSGYVYTCAFKGSSADCVASE